LVGFIGVFKSGFTQ